MPNIANLLKSEITRLAKKQVKAETDDLRKVNSHYRSEIAALKKRLAALESQLKKTARIAAAAPAAPAGEEPPERLRFSAKGLAAHRKRLDLSAAAFGALVGVTGQSIYKWETGKARPRASQMQAIAQIRTIGKKEARARLEQLSGSPVEDEEHAEEAAQA